MRNKLLIGAWLAGMAVGSYFLNSCSDELEISDKVAAATEVADGAISGSQLQGIVERDEKKLGHEDILGGSYFSALNYYSSKAAELEVSGNGNDDFDKLLDMYEKMEYQLETMRGNGLDKTSLYIHMERKHWEIGYTLVAPILTRIKDCHMYNLDIVFPSAPGCEIDLATLDQPKTKEENLKRLICDVKNVEEAKKYCLEHGVELNSRNDPDFKRKFDLIRPMIERYQSVLE